MKITREFGCSVIKSCPDYPGGSQFKNFSEALSSRNIDTIFWVPDSKMRSIPPTPKHTPTPLPTKTSTPTLTYKILHDGFHFPGAGTTDKIGPFCCTGETAVVYATNGDPIGYIYFYTVNGQAYIIGNDRSIAPDIKILVSGITDAQDHLSPQQQSSIDFPANQMIPGNSLSTRAGILNFTVYIDNAILETRDNQTYFDMGTVAITVSVSGIP
jgi:hypothetical protein